MRIEAYFLLAIFSGVWGISLWGTWALCRHFKRRSAPADPLPPISILKPLKGEDAGLEANLRSFFELPYPRFEILFSVATVSDAALPVVQRLMDEYPSVSARVFIGGSAGSENPKVNNLALSYRAAKFEVILISDSNVRVLPSYLHTVARSLSDKVGIVTAVVKGEGAESFGGELEAGYLNTFYARWMFIAKAFGFPPVVGKSMVFTKQTLARLGDLEVLGKYIAEDYMAGFGVRQLGLSVTLLEEPIPQYIGRYGFQEFWARHLRWGRIRKSMAPIAYASEVFTTPICSALIGAWGGARLGFPFWAALLFCILAWWFLDLWQLGRLRVLNFTSAGLWWVRELFTPLIWATVMCGNTVSWRGRRYRLLFGGTLEEVA